MAHEDGREHEVVESFIRFADRLVDDFDILDLTMQLTEDCVRLLDVSAAGLLLADAAGVLHLLAATSASARMVEVFQLQRDEGPCLDCFASGTPVSVADLSAAAGSWPRFVPVATQAGFASVHAIPMRLRDEMLGALGLFGAHPGELSIGDRRLGQALAHVASIAIGQQGDVVTGGTLLPGLQAAVASRGLLEIARGVVAAALSVDVERALDLIRTYAMSHKHQLGDVARILVSGDRAARDQLVSALAGLIDR